MKNEFKLGHTATDKITGATGIVICVAHWLNGCVRVSFQPQTLKDGLPSECVTLDIEQLDFSEDVVVNINATPTGGPSISPTQRKDITR